jgi:DNA sulfur modification protein DndE
LSLDNETLTNQFRLHLHRGIGYLAAAPDIKKIEDLIEIEALAKNLLAID